MQEKSKYIQTNKNVRLALNLQSNFCKNQHAFFCQKFQFNLSDQAQSLVSFQ